jgi:two-component system, OmpR family, sensor histidine kinase BaeS
MTDGRPPRRSPPRPAGGRPRGRPPWWPEDEPFPPERGFGPRGRHSFARRAVFIAAGFFAFLFVLNALGFLLFSRDFGPGRPDGRGPPGPFFGLLLLIVVFLVAGRIVRWLAAPVGSVMEAADRVAGGDYGARVSPQGPRDMRRLARSFNVMAERIEASESQRRNLLADIAHELRTPMAVIRGNVEGMLDGVYPVDDKRLRRLVDETTVMSRLLDDLQTLSMAEAGVLVLHRERVEPEVLLEDAIGAFGPHSAGRGVELERAVEPGTPAIEADPVRLGEVLANLVSNAVRHTPAGGRVTISAGTSGGRRVAFDVTDSGPGIGPEELPHIFDRFVKAADSGGAGLGLAIAKSIVEAHGGTITATSTPGRTTFRFEVPQGLGSS